MLLNYIRLTFRTLLKNKTTFLINWIGMSIALGCCITAYVNYEFNEGFDKQQANAPTLYRVAFHHEEEGKLTPYGVAPMPVGGLIRENFSEVSQVVRYISKGAQFRIGDEMFQSEFIYADPNYIRVFTIQPLHGSIDISNKSDVIISDRLAIKYFGNTDVVGKQMTQVIGADEREFTIGGVYKSFPANSSFRFDILSTFDNYFIDPSQQSVIEGDWKKWSTVFLQINNASVIPQLESGFRPM